MTRQLPAHAELSRRALWPASGGELTVSATGDNYAAFSAIVDAPVLVNVANPLATSMPDILRASNYNLDWNNGGAGTVEVAIAAANKTLTCTFVSIDGVGAISPAALSTLSAGPGTVSITVFNAVTADGGIVVRAETPALDSNGAAFVDAVTLH